MENTLLNAHSFKNTVKLIKVLNSAAYGYRNFNNFKNHILLHIKLKLGEQNSLSSQEKRSGFQVT